MLLGCSMPSGVIVMHEKFGTFRGELYIHSSGLFFLVLQIITNWEGGVVRDSVVFLRATLLRRSGNGMWHRTGSR